MTHEAISKFASDATYTGSAISAGLAVPHYVFGLTLDEWSVVGIIFGMVIAFAGWMTNLYFKREHLRLATQAARLRLSEDEE